MSPAEFWANLHNRGGFCTGRSHVQCVNQREGKKPCPSPYPKIPPKATGLSHAYFQSHLADSRTRFTRSVCSYPPIPICSLSDAAVGERLLVCRVRCAP